MKHMLQGIIKKSSRHDRNSMAKSECPRVVVDVNIPGSPGSASPDISPMAGPTCTANIMWYLREIEEEVRKDLAEYFCTGNLSSLHINIDNLDTYLYVCNSLQLRALKKHCQKACVQLLKQDNCLRVLQIAESNKSPYLIRHSTRMIVEHFGELWKTEDFQCLGKSHLKTLMKHSGITCHPDMREALKYWLAYEKELRQESFQDLIAHLEVFECNVKEESEKAAGEGSGSDDEQHPGKPNVDYSHIALLAIEDDSDKLTGISITLENSAIVQKKIKNVQNPGTEFAVCSMEVDTAPYILISGGKLQASQQLLKYDVVLNKWKKCKKMLTGRCRHNMVSLKETMYILGGYDGERQLNSIEKYDFRKDVWEKVDCDLVHPVRSAACAVYNNQIYLFGGKDENDQRVATIQCFDPERNTIRKLTDLPCVTACGRAVQCGQYIYIVSGQGHLVRFDPDTETSELCEEQPFHRIHFGAFTYTQKIYIAGGINGEGERFSCIYEYDPEKNSWKKFGQFPTAAPVFGACAVNFRPFAEDM